MLLVKTEINDDQIQISGNKTNDFLNTMPGNLIVVLKYLAEGATKNTSFKSNLFRPRCTKFLVKNSCFLSEKYAL